MTYQHFRARLCPYSTSPDPIRAIWIHQHVCVAESLDWANDPQPSQAGMVNAIIRELKQGHYDVLRSAHATVNFSGFPHAAAMQWRTHQSMGTLTQSLRYTGKRFQNERKLTDKEISKLFYVRHDNQIGTFRQGIFNYNTEIACGAKMEVARDVLPSGYLQGWSTSGDLKAWFHLLDRRLLGDTQEEARIAAELAVDQLTEWCPDLLGWFMKHRAGKNKLAP